MAMAGEDLTIKFILHRRMMLEMGQRFQVRDAKLTLGSGIVTKLEADVPEKEIEQIWQTK
jgi:elongation factor Tu